MLEVKTFSTVYPQGDVGITRCHYETRLFKSNKLGHAVCIKYGVSSYFIVYLVVDDCDLLHQLEARGELLLLCPDKGWGEVKEETEKDLAIQDT